MQTLVRETAAGAISSQETDQLADEISAAALPCLGLHIERGIDIAGNADITKDKLTLYFDSAPDELLVDAAIAAFPVTPESVTGTYDALSGDNYLLEAVRVNAGESLALDIHLHVAYGLQADFEPAQFDYYACVFRRTTGPVLATDPAGAKTGKLPGLAIKIVCDANYAWIYVTQRASGKLTVIHSDIIVKSRGSIPQ